MWAAASVIKVAIVEDQRDIGNALAVLINGNAMNPGRYMMRWDGRNLYGQSVATGVYFYRLVAGDFVQSKKMVLVK